MSGSFVCEERKCRGLGKGRPEAPRPVGDGALDEGRERAGVPGSETCDRKKCLKLSFIHDD